MLNLTKLTIGILLVKNDSIQLRVRLIKMFILVLIFLLILASYYRGASGIMLVYDVTQARSFENINKWLRNIDDHASDDVVKMLIGNKCDMDDRRCIARARGEALAREHNIPFLETSAKNNINIEKAFFEISRLILNKTPMNSPDPTPGGPGGKTPGTKPTNQSSCMNCM